MRTLDQSVTVSENKKLTPHLYKISFLFSLTVTD